LQNPLLAGGVKKSTRALVHQSTSKSRTAPTNPAPPGGTGRNRGYLFDAKSGVWYSGIEREDSYFAEPKRR